MEWPLESRITQASWHQKDSKTLIFFSSNYPQTVLSIPVSPIHHTCWPKTWENPGLTDTAKRDNNTIYTRQFLHLLRPLVSRPAAHATHFMTCTVLQHPHRLEQNKSSHTPPRFVYARCFSFHNSPNVTQLGPTPKYAASIPKFEQNY